MENNKHTFKVTVDDGMDSYQYDFELSSRDVSIYSIAEAIAENFGVEVPEGHHIKKENPLSF